MKRRGNLFLIAGCLLVAGSLVLLVYSRIHSEQARKRNVETVAQIAAIIPPRSDGAMDSYSNMEMPVLQIGGEDYIGLLDIPAFGLTLPIGSSWDTGKVTTYPCRFWGTVYDGSLIVGGADQPGQLDCLDQIWNGSIVTVTDMTGSVFRYVVSSVERSKTAHSDVLVDESAALTLFVRDAYNLEYIIVRCAVKGSV